MRLRILTALMTLLTLCSCNEQYLKKSLFLYIDSNMFDGLYDIIFLDENRILGSGSDGLVLYTISTKTKEILIDSKKEVDAEGSRKYYQIMNLKYNDNRIYFNNISPINEFNGQFMYDLNNKSISKINNGIVENKFEFNNLFTEKDKPSGYHPLFYDPTKQLIFGSITIERDRSGLPTYLDLISYNKYYTNRMLIAHNLSNGPVNREIQFLTSKIMIIQRAGITITDISGRILQHYYDFNGAQFALSPNSKWIAIFGSVIKDITEMNDYSSKSNYLYRGTLLFKIDQDVLRALEGYSHQLNSQLFSDEIKIKQGEYFHSRINPEEYLLDDMLFGYTYKVRIGP